ncbi:hypothetical protein G9A89_014586 [Geosiphon pyriformis]|nr:hypothetical protein G9A89_014586 [Geosiphon pyriformis]
MKSNKKNSEASTAINITTNKYKKQKNSPSKYPKNIISTFQTTALSQPLAWPSLSQKPELETKILVLNQIVSITSFFSLKECTNFIDFIDQFIPLKAANPTLIPKKGEAYRDNDRFSVEDRSFAETLYAITGLSKMIFSLIPCNSSKTVKTVVGLNPNIRIYRYSPGQKFGPHYDESVKDSLGRVSGWTLLIYLNGGEEEREVPLVGGETVFYRGKKGDEIVVKPTRGLALLHKHGFDCLLHEALEVKKGTKYLLRTDPIQALAYVSLISKAQLVIIDSSSQVRPPCRLKFIGSLYIFPLESFRNEEIVISVISWDV